MVKTEYQKNYLEEMKKTVRGIGILLLRYYARDFFNGITLFYWSSCDFTKVALRSLRRQGSSDWVIEMLFKATFCVFIKNVTRKNKFSNYFKNT